MSNAQQAYDSLIATLKEINLLGSVASTLNWDEQVMMPPKGAELRSQQLALLARMTHEQFTSPQIDQWLTIVEQSDLVREPYSAPAVNVRETRRMYDRKRKVPASLVEEIARTESLAQHAWVEARKNSDYPAFRPWLEKILHLKRQQAACLLDGKQPDNHSAEALYDALLEDYEPGMTTVELQRMFDELRAPLVELVGQIAASGRSAPIEILHRNYPRDLQEKLAREAAERIGFDFSAGRLDVSVHPFCSGIGPGDTRLTTRYNEQHFGDAFFGVLHEAGHGLYHQGLPAEHFGTPRGHYVSLGIHESQSRLWENFVGRGRALWRFFFPRARAMFGDALADVTEEQWYGAINSVHPSLIRVEADEATYNLHILLRFELEVALIGGQLDLADLPGAWNEKMKAYLGIDVPDDRRGVLQDIHWSGGAIGYFPTYTLGNLYAAMFYQKAKTDVPDTEDAFARGDFAPLLTWLRKHIHEQGMTRLGRDLVQHVTGQSPTAGPLLHHLRTKASEVYGI